MVFQPTSRTLAIVSLFCALSTGCAFGTRHTTLSYPPAESKARASNEKTADAAARPASTSLGKLAVAPFVDSRADKHRIGCMRNGFGMETADVVAENDPTVFATEALRYELKNAGWELVDLASADSSHTPIVSGEIVLLRCDAYLVYEGETSFLIRVIRDDQKLYEKTVSGKGGGSTNWAGSAEAFGESVSQATEIALQSFMRELPAVFGTP